MKDFFISYTKADESAAEWVAYVLEEAGYSVTIMKWDFKAGGNFVLDMQKAAEECERILPILSPNYLQSIFTQPEWAVAFAKDPTGTKGLLIPVRAIECELKGLLPQIVYIDLFNKNENEARKTLLNQIEQTVKKTRGKPKTKPKFAGFTGDAQTKKQRYPGTLPLYWNMPIQRNVYFAGREQVLEQLDESLKTEQGAALTQVIKGLGGIGKTQIAVEYAYRNHTKYDIVWWVNAETEVTIQSAYALLAEELDLPEKDVQEQEIKVKAALKYLNQNPDWLLIFDNVESGDTIYPYRPQHKLGHVIVTTRNQSLQRIGKSISIDTWTNEEARQFVKTRINNANDKDITSLCELLGNLPLGMEQAVAYIAASGLSIQDYIELFNNNQQKYLSKSSIPEEEYNTTVATTWTLAIRKIQDSMPGAIELLNMCAFMAPNQIPLDLIARQADLLPESLQGLLNDKAEMAEMAVLFKRYSIADIENNLLSIHRLVQIVIRYGLTDEQARASLGCVVDVLDNSLQGLDPTRDVKAWPIFKALHLHILLAGKYAQEHEVTLARIGYLYNEMGLYLKTIGLYQQVEALYIETSHINAKVLGKQHPSYAVNLNNLAALYFSQEQYDKAEPLYIESRDIRAKIFGKKHSEYAQSLSNLAELYRFQGKFDKAEPLYIEAKNVFANTIGNEHPYYATVLNNQALFYNAQAQYDKAEPLYREDQRIIAKVLGKEHPHYATSLNNMAWFYRSQGQYDKAEPLYIEAIKILENVFGPDHPNAITCRENYRLMLDNMSKKK